MLHCFARARIQRPGLCQTWLMAGVAMLALTLGTGCSSGSGEGLDAGGRPVSDTVIDDPPVLNASLKSIQDQVFTLSCAVSGCHTGAAAPVGLRLDEGNSFALLVNVPSFEVPNVLRVAPGLPAESYLIQKLNGTAAVGGRMPLEAPALAQSTIDIIAQWIADGAVNDAPVVEEPPSGPAVVQVTPADGSNVSERPTQIEVLLSEELDAALVSNTTVSLIRAGGDDSFSDGNETAMVITTAVDAANARRLLIDTAEDAEAADTYQLTLRGDGATVLASLDGIALDGDGNGEPGGDFVSVFTLAGIQPTLQSIQANIFTPTCSSAGCHSGPAGSSLPAGQDLTSIEASFASLFNVPSVQVPQLLRVQPGHPDDSYLVQKLEGSASVGARMPLVGDPLPADSIDAVRAWIAAGAPLESGDENDDTLAPQVTLTLPDGNLAGVVTLTVDAVDDTGIALVRFIIDDTVVSADDAAPYTFDWDSTQVSDGEHRFSAEALDTAGNSAQTSELIAPVFNDMQAPSVEITSPANGATVGGQIIVAIQASDNEAVAQVTLQLDGVSIGSDDSAPYEFIWDTTLTGAGQHQLSASAVDAAGNTADSAVVLVLVDNTCTDDTQAPEVSLSAPSASLLRGTVEVAAQASDDTAITQVLFLLDGNLIEADVDAPYATQWDTTLVADGDYALSARALDACANATDSAPLNVQVDNTAPTVSDVSVTDGATVNTLPTSIEITLDQAPSPSTVTAASVLFTRSVNGIFGDADDATLDAPTSLDSTRITLALDAITSVDDSYQISLLESITDPAGNPLDGDADGSPGGDYLLRFTVSTPLAIASVDPHPDALLAEFPAVVTVQFNKPPLAGTVNSTSLSLIRNVDGMFGDGDDLAVAATVSLAGDLATLDLSALPASIEDNFRIIATEAITDASGNALDGDGDGLAGGEYRSDFTTDLTTWSDDAAPIFTAKCAPCHTDFGAGGHNVATVYEDALLDANSCPGLNVGQCTIVLIQSGAMPQSAGCSGDPAADAANPACLSAEEQTTIINWIDQGLAE